MTLLCDAEKGRYGAPVELIKLFAAVALEGRYDGAVRFVKLEGYDEAVVSAILER